jgi:hypothetical protein
MKLRKTLLLASAAAALLLIPQTTRAADSAMSPKQRQWAEQNRRVGGLAEVDMLDRGVKGKSPKLVAQENERRRVSGRTVDRIARRVTGTTPRYMANHRPASRPWDEQFMLAPVK